MNTDMSAHVEESDRANDSFQQFYGIQSLNGRNPTSYIFDGLVLRGSQFSQCQKLRGVFVFEITKTKTPKFSAKCALKLRGNDRTEDNSTDQT